MRMFRRAISVVVLTVMTAAFGHCQVMSAAEPPADERPAAAPTKESDVVGDERSGQQTSTEENPEFRWRPPMQFIPKQATGPESLVFSEKIRELEARAKRLEQQLVGIQRAQSKVTVEFPDGLERGPDTVVVEKTATVSVDVLGNSGGNPDLTPSDLLQALFNSHPSTRVASLFVDGLVQIVDHWDDIVLHTELANLKAQRTQLQARIDEVESQLADPDAAAVVQTETATD